MQTHSKTKSRKGSTSKQDEELRAFAHHLSEALRIAYDSPHIPASFYNDLFGATLDFESCLKRGGAEVTQTETHILGVLTAYAEQEGRANQ